MDKHYKTQTAEEKHQFYKRIRKTVGNKLRLAPDDRVLGMSKRITPSQFGYIYGRNSRDMYLQQIYGSVGTRTHRIKEYDLMDATEPLVHTALDIFASDSTIPDPNNDYHVIKIISDNEQIREELEDLFFWRLDIDSNLQTWIRCACKYGDHFLVLNLDTSLEKSKGIMQALEVPVLEIERNEIQDPVTRETVVQFIWNQINGASLATGNVNDFGDSKILNWAEVAHFKMEGNDPLFRPYGKPKLEVARNAWRALKMMEDAMLVYRLTRAPERRVFKVEVGALPDDKVEDYVKRQLQTIKKQETYDQSTGDINLNYNVWAHQEDFALPVRGGVGSSIEQLPGASNLDQIADVEYCRDKLISSLGIPKAYLSYDESLQTRATLSMEDTRFANTVQKIQKSIAFELRKMAYVHLAAIGIEEEELFNFDIVITNPSSTEEENRIELENKRIDYYGSVLDKKAMSATYARKNILKMSDEDILLDKTTAIEDAKIAYALKQLEEEGIPWEETMKKFELSASGSSTAQAGGGEEKSLFSAPGGGGGGEATPTPTTGGETAGGGTETGGEDLFGGGGTPGAGGTETAAVDPFTQDKLIKKTNDFSLRRKGKYDVFDDIIENLDSIRKKEPVKLNDNVQNIEEKEDIIIDAIKPTIEETIKNDSPMSLDDLLTQIESLDSDE